MAFCPHCGSPAAPGTSFCSACGRSLPGAASPAPHPAGAAPAAPRWPAAEARPPRPVGVTIVGVVLFMASVAMAFGALVVFAGSQWLAGYVPVAEARSVFTVFGPVVAMGMLLAAGLVAFAGYGALDGRSWAWALVLVLLGLNALGALAQLAEGDVGGVLGLLVSGLVIWYFFRPEVRAWFGQAP